MQCINFEELWLFSVILFVSTRISAKLFPNALQYLLFMLLHTVFEQYFKADIFRFNLALSIETDFLVLHFDGDKFIIAAYFNKHSLKFTFVFFCLT